MEGMTKVIALDPGGTTGWCSHTIDKSGWSGGQIEGDDHHRALANVLTGEGPDVVVYEAFNYQIRQGGQMPGVDLIAREYIGVAKLWCQLHPHVTLIKQQPSVVGLTWLKDPALKKLGLHTSGERHHNDATRHLLYYIVQTLGLTDYLLPLRG